jgi:hypothetical protein
MYNYFKGYGRIIASVSQINRNISFFLFQEWTIWSQSEESIEVRDSVSEVRDFLLDKKSNLIHFF